MLPTSRFPLDGRRKRARDTQERYSTGTRRRERNPGLDPQHHLSLRHPPLLRVKRVSENSLTPAPSSPPAPMIHLLNMYIAYISYESTRTLADLQVGGNRRLRVLLKTPRYLNVPDLLLILLRLLYKDCMILSLVKKM